MIRPQPAKSATNPLLVLALGAALSACGGGAPAEGGMAPTLSQVDPAHVPQSGAKVVLRGSHFASGARVLFGAGAAPVDAEWLSDAELAAVAVPHAPGVVDVTVVNPDGQRGTLAGALQFDADPPPPPAAVPPSIASIAPASGPDAGETTVTIAGSGFASPVASFGGAAAALVAATPTSLTVVTPPHAAAAVDVVVTNADGLSATLAAAFTYVRAGLLPPPSVSGIAPSSGPTGGNTVVTVSGSGFVMGSTVLIGGTAAIVGAVTATGITATTPGGPAGPADVTVTNPDRQSATLPGGFTYLAPPPVVTATNVRGSPQAGGGLLLFAGTGLQNTVSVSFGGAPATGLTYDPQTGTLLVTIPPSPLGPTADVFVDLVLTNADGQSATWPGFHYGNPPSPSGFTPAGGLSGTAVVISGADFSADATGPRAGLQVSFGGALAVIDQKSPTQITVTAPKLNAGVYPVIVTNFDGQYAIAPGIFSVTGP